MPSHHKVYDARPPEDVLRTPGSSKGTASAGVGGEEVFQERTEKYEKDEALMVGDRVRIFGLQSSVALNGKIGRLSDYRADTGRWDVELQEGASSAGNVVMWSGK